MQILNKWIFRTIVTLLLMAWHGLAFSQTNPLLGSEGRVKVDSFRIIKDEIYFSEASNASIIPNSTRIRNLVSVSIEEDSKIYIPADFTATLRLYITKYDNQRNIYEELDSNFTVNYTKAEGATYNASARLIFENAYQVEVKIVSIDPHGTTAWDVSSVLRVDNILEASHDFVFNCEKKISNLQLFPDDSKGELTVSWKNSNSGETEYDLEWAWIDEGAIDDYHPFSPEKIFENNATRVTISRSSYNIPLLYDDAGRIFVRVRPAQIKLDGQRIEGEWTWDFNENALPVQHYFSGHENSLNWQASTSYAEEGKRKSVVQYFDGTLRNRQTVTKDNTSGTTIVAESFYDYQGRPVLQVLPAPTLNTMIAYAKNFNQFANFTGYPKEAYDRIGDDASICDDPSKPLSTNTGTANYYSPDNPLLNNNPGGYNENKYIPNSEGDVSGEAYPFTETRFAADGRLASQGGVGPDFRIGSGHETKYYYESVAQEELDALFGTEAGVAAHYFKNIVRDANGQYSVGYSDMHGRTIATALLGDAPAKLDPLESYNKKTTTQQLIDDETNRVVGKAIISSKSLVVPVDGDYTFTYELKPDQLKLMACDLNAEICYDCVYNLQITITADCNDKPDFPFTVVDSNFTLTGLLEDPVCNESGKAELFFSKLFTKRLTEGAYTITKTLTLNDKARDIFREAFIESDNCKTFEDYYNETYQVLLSQSNCIITCESCMTSIGENFDIFKARFIAESRFRETLNDSMIIALRVAYNEAKANCDRICNTDNSDGLEVTRSIIKEMLRDVSPPDGQYATLDNENKIYSIFNATSNWDPVFPSFRPPYENPINYTWNDGVPSEDPNFKNELGLNDNPVYDAASPEDQPQVFTDQFKPSWAQQLLPNHPEYCKLKLTMEQLTATYDFGAKLNRLDTWTSLLNATSTPGQYITNLLGNDPFFTGPGKAYRERMEIKLRDFMPLKSAASGNCGTFDLNKFASLWQIAQSSVFCRNMSTEGCLNSEQSQCLLTTPGTPPITPETCSQDWDLVWKFYRTNYLTERNKWIAQYLDEGCPVKYDMLVDKGYSPKFINLHKSSAIGNSDISDLKDFFDQLAAGDNAAIQSGQQLLDQQYAITCLGYASLWISQLAECETLFERWKDQATKTADSSWLVPRLIEVCKNGADLSHYLGSSSVIPGKVTSSGFTDFPQIIQLFLENSLGITNATGECNPYLITIPQAYDKQQPLTEMAVITKPTDCECTQISKVNVEYTSAGYTGTFSDYMLQRYQVAISDSALSALISLCDGSYQCAFLPQPITLPPAFQCYDENTPRPDNSCISCGQYQAIKDSFSIVYNRPAPGSFPLNAEDSSYSLAFTNFVNYQTGFHKTFDEYLFFGDSCAHYTGSSFGNGGADCDSLQSLIVTFNQNVRKGKVTHSWETQEGKILRDLTQLVVNGALQLPDSVRQLPNTWYNNYGFNFSRFCGGNGYSQEIRFRFLKNIKTGDIFYWSVPDVGFTARRYTSGVLKGISINTPSGNYVLDTNPEADLDWMTFKAKIVPGTSALYYNGKLIFQVATDPNKIPGDLSAFGIGLFGRQAYIDWVKISDAQDNVKYFEDFNDPYNLATVDPSFICPPYNCDSAFVVYFNQKRGTRYTIQQIDSLSMATCGKGLAICNYTAPPDTTSDCTNLTKILNNYRATFVTSSTRYVDLDMRTFSGNKTPKEGPKGVFDVNNQFIENTIDGTPEEINHSFASIWNSNADNATIGSLEVLNNGRFRLHLQPGQVMPCQGIIGMRYYQFECPNQYIDAIICGPGSYIDFGDGTQIKVDSAYSDAATDIFSSSGGVTAQSIYLKTYYVLHRFTTASLRTISVYHSDIRGIVGFDNWNSGSINLTTLKNLRGYLPDDTKRITFHSTQDSTLNTFNQIANKNKIIHLQSIDFSTGDNITHFQNYHFDSFTHNPGIRVATIQTLDSLLINTVLPDIPVNFKKLQVLVSFGYNYSDEVKLLMPEATHINIQYGLKSYQVDTILNQLARSVTKDSGSIYMRWGNEPRTGASDAAINVLHAKGWFVFTASDTTFNPIPIIKVIDSIVGDPVLHSEFSDYVNARLHTNYTHNQVMNLYAGQCSQIPDVCNVPPVITNNNGPRLCGGNVPVFEKLVYTPEPCKDLDKMAYTYAEEKWHLYRDSVRNVFDTAYYNKCMSAKNLESFTVSYQTSEYHYTLYYYDQAGNLVKTVPPAGIDYKQGGDLDMFLTKVKTGRADALINGASETNKKVPEHTLTTQYRYNTLNQIVAQNTPDAGLSSFWYDALGRLVVSQNAKQASPLSTSGEGPGVRYSYTLYDPLGRITEVGQKPKPNGVMNQNLTRNPDRLRNWLNNNQKREQITRTGYDVKFYDGSDGNDLTPILYQRNLRNRVSYTQVFDLEPPGNKEMKWFGKHNAATYYTYDIHGNVDTLLQDYNAGSMKTSGNRYKMVAYDYDLISGKVNRVQYQPPVLQDGKLVYPPDYFVHRYQYDAENRLTDVETSTDNMVWEKDARYFYYKHGPLARTILGQNQVQGIDYAYTLQGWLKGVNSTAVGVGSFDMGGDGNAGGGNGNIGRDAYGFALSYYNNDYKSISPSTKSFANAAAAGFGFKALYNGNIAAMGVNVPKIGEPLLYTYTYDQLNRITKMFTYKGLNLNTNSWNVSAFQDYREQVSYDANGNILTYRRNGDASRSNVSSSGMDNLTYSYKPGTNQLDKVVDAAPDAAAGEYDKYNDIRKGQTDGNYEYDGIGNLIRDRSEGITKIEWTVYGKISSITKNGGINISYTYDASGNRISKNENDKETFYVRDASGNVMSIYRKEALINNGDLSQTEIHLYGSSRLGVYNLKNNVQKEETNPGRILTFTRGNKFFELSNHLGNVLATVSDKKLQHFTDNVTFDYSTVEVVNAQDYYPFGMMMPGRKYSMANTNYRYGFNGKENDKEVSGTTTYDYGFRIYNPGLGRFLSVDPLQVKHQDESPYLYGGANPIAFSDPDGRDRIISTTTIYDLGEGIVVSFISKRIVKEDFIINQTKNQNGTVHYLYLDTYEQHVNYYNGATGEQKNFSQISYPVRFKSDYDTRNWTGKVGRGWDNFKNWFNNLVKEGHEGYHEGGGIMFTSKIGQGTDRGPKRKFIDATPVNIDLMVETIAQLKTTTGYEKTKDFLNILERFAGKIETGKNLREEIEKMKKEVADKTLEPAVKTPAVKNSSPAEFRNPKPDSIFVHENWQGKTSDGERDSSNSYMKKMPNPDKKKPSK